MMWLSVCVMLCVPAAARAQDNLVANPGFEDGATGWSLVNDWYARNDPKRASPAVIEQTMAHSGQACLRIDGAGSRGLAIQSPVGVQAGVRYRVSCWMRGEDMGDARAGPLIEFWTAQNKHIAGEFWSEQVPEDWRRVSHLIYAPENTGYAKLMCATTSNNDGRVWFDDVVVKPALPPPPVPAQARGHELVWDAYEATPSVAYFRVYAAEQPFDNVALMRAVAWLAADARSIDVTALPEAAGKTCFAVVAVDEDDLEEPRVTCVKVGAR